MVHGEEIWIRNGVRVNAMNKHQKSGGRIFKRCVDLCCISPSAVLLHRSLLADVGLFREDFPVCEDYELWLRISAFEAVGFIEEPLIKKYGGHEDQLSRSVVGMDLWRLRALLPFVKEDFVRRDYGSLDEGRIGIGTGIGIDTGAGLGAGTGACLTKDIHVRDLLSGTFNEEFALISEDERAYALVVALQRIEILRKGAVKHANAELLSELDEIDLMLKV